MTNAAPARLDTDPDPLVEALASTLPGGVVVMDSERVEKYRHDRFEDLPAGHPRAVVRAQTTEQVQVALRWATEHRIPVVPRGAGTSLSGGATAVDGCLVLSLERMTGIQIDPDRRVARAEPGALNISVKEAAAVHELWYPPDPGSFRISTIGGNIATNAGGLCCVKYGVTADYVLGLEVVLADGRLLRLGGETMKDVAGLNLRQLFVGSEGTLGVVTGAVLRLVPRQGDVSTLVATFPDLVSAGTAVTRIGRTIRPAMLELMDQVAINAVEDFSPRGLDRDAGALLIVQSDAPGRARAEEIAAVERLCHQAGCTEVLSTDDADEGLMFVDARRSSGDAVEARGTLLAEDICVPVDRLPDVLAEIAAIGERHDLEIPVVAHAGDGNLHPGIVYPPGDAAARGRAWRAFDDLMALAPAYGGTVTGEHGVGRTKVRSLAAQVGADVLDVSHAVKTALDPLGLLNPGALLPSGDRPTTLGDTT
ncbi:FAD-binding protein [Nocardioides carbamazepini]|uniref:FAD-binding oxidoreductase n=1 Tax=Nocardioides carbamazepini TaxID=2854259 RepID=UPI00214A8165|nr:FAD-linked oxidase C-terminal domain-containing protein [Nocardioides carbamazepini]MCR1782461.1 FAD-binding protein [Nocardioides carbamazepini]